MRTPALDDLVDDLELRVIILETRLDSWVRLLVDMAEARTYTMGEDR